MSVSLASCTLTVTGEATLHDTSDPVSVPSQTVQIGSGFETLTYTLEDGTGVGQANQLYAAQVTVPAGGNLDLDLSGGLTNFRGATITFTKVKLAVFAVVAPDGTKKVWVGPQGVTNAAQLWFKGAGADAAEEVFRHAQHVHPDAGWTVTAGTGDKLRLANPGGADVLVDVLMVGVQ